MRTLMSVVITAFALVVGLAHLQARGQATPTSGQLASSWTCAAPNPMHAVPVGDAPDHVYVVEQAKCTATKGEVGGIAEKEGTATEFADVRGEKATGHGVFVETLANGDTLYLTYTFEGTSKDKVLQSGTNKWRLTNGTGKFKGAKGGGTCTGKGNADGSANYECRGTYTLAK
jgi:hypothetical protein